MPLLDWNGFGDRGPLTAGVREAIARDVVESAYKIIEGKGATNYAIGLAGSRIIEAILKDEHRILPVSSLLEGYHGISDVCLSVPAVVAADGVGERMPVPMSSDEPGGHAALRRRGALGRSAVRVLDDTCGLAGPDRRARRSVLACAGRPRGCAARSPHDPAPSSRHRGSVRRRGSAASATRDRPCA